jgi:F-box domain
MIFNRLNFYGHLRLSVVCTHWKNLVQNDVLFMKTVKFKAEKMNEHHTLMRSYKCVDLRTSTRTRTTNDPPDLRWHCGENLQKLLKTVERIEFGDTEQYIVNLVMPLCENLKEVQLSRFKSSYRGTYKGPKADMALTFNHRSPIKISISTLCTEFLDRFDVITEISELGLITLPSEELMAKYGGVIKSLNICFYSSLECWHRLENVQLQHLDLSGCILQDDQEKSKAAVQLLFEQQAPFLKTIEIWDSYIDVYVFFDPIRMLLKNLVEISFAYSYCQGLHLNDLKVLPKLKCLDIRMFLGGESEYHLDVVELIALNELRLTSDTKNSPRLRIVSRNQPLNAMEKMQLFGFSLDCESLKQLAHTMPRLKVLEIEY